MKKLIFAAALAVAAVFAAPAPAAGATAAPASTATILKLCPDNSLVAYTGRCPTSGTVKKVCPDGSVVGYTAKCAASLTWTLNGWTSKAGIHEQFVIIRSSSVGAALITFATGDGTAKAGPDYDATKVNVPFAAGQASQMVAVGTHVNPAAAGQTQTFYGMISDAGRSVSTAVATILQPAAAPPPPPPPVPAPPPPLPPMPLAAGGNAKALTACQATNRPEGAIAGQTYKLVEFASAGDGTALAVLSDATHLGDGYFALYVPTACLVGV